MLVLKQTTFTEFMFSLFHNNDLHLTAHRLFSKQCCVNETYALRHNHETSNDNWLSPALWITVEWSDCWTYWHYEPLRNQSSTTKWSRNVKPSGTKKRRKSFFPRVAYHGAMSPLHAWAITLLSAIIPWLCLVPWTPFEIGQHFISCSNEKYPWPCLTFYMSCFLRAVMR